MSDSPPDPSEIPLDRLPEGFAERVRDPGEPAEPRPAATIVLTRPGPAGIEILLMRRVRTAGFVPGAWVFPGGRVDSGDADPKALARIRSFDRSESGRAAPEVPDAPLPSLVAALREAFEETGILVARDERGHRVASAGESTEIDQLRRAVLADETGFGDLLEARGWWMDSSAIGYIAHWITPEAEPRRYDTRFFAAAVPRDATERIHEAEATAALWVSPAEALRRHADGEFPMIFPTLKTLEALQGFQDPTRLLEHYRGRTIRTILPTLVRTPTGVGIRVPDQE